ncbi:MAG: FAD-binding protein [Pseudomonadota bacterium]
MTAWGGGTSLEGDPIPANGGIVLDFTRMDRVIEVGPPTCRWTWSLVFPTSC